MDPWPSGIDAITVVRHGPGGGEGLYQRTFGPSVLFEDEDSVVFNFGNVVVDLLRASQVSGLIRTASPTFAVDDLVDRTPVRMRDRPERSVGRKAERHEPYAEAIFGDAEDLPRECLVFDG